MQHSCSALVGTPAIPLSFGLDTTLQQPKVDAQQQCLGPCACFLQQSCSALVGTPGIPLSFWTLYNTATTQASCTATMPRSLHALCSSLAQKKTQRCAWSDKCQLALQSVTAAASMHRVPGIVAVHQSCVVAVLYKSKNSKVYLECQPKVSKTVVGSMHRVLSIVAVHQKLKGIPGVPSKAEQDWCKKHAQGPRHCCCASTLSYCSVV